MSKCTYIRLALLCCLFWVNPCISQNNNIAATDSLNEVQILPIYIEPVGPFYHVKMDGQHSLIPIDKALEQNEAIYFKKYGSGQLSGISINGMNSTQTNVVWNGMNLNSSMLGQADFSIVPTNNISGISLSNAIDNLGGAVQMNSDFYMSEPWSFRARIGTASFGTLSSSLEYARKINSFSSKTSISYKRAQNDFKYINRSVGGGIESKLDNAKTQQFGLGQSFQQDYKKHQLTLHYIQSNNKRQIPPTVFESNSTASQDDNLYAVVLGDNIDLNEHLDLTAQVGYQFQKINFKLSENSEADLSKMGSLQSFLVLFHDWKKWNFRYRTAYTLEHGNIEAYSKRQLRNQSLTSLNVNFNPTSSHSLNAGVHVKTYSKGKATIFPDVAYSFSHYKLSHSIFVIEYAHHIRVPTLNDLFWVPGGEPNLEAEHSKQLDLKWNLSDYFLRKKVGYNLTVSNYHIFAKNFIQWQPTPNGYWSPVNLGEVYSRGMKFKLLVYKDFKKDWKFGIKTNYTLSRITMKHSTEQLVYVPLNQLVVAPYVNWKGFKFEVTNRFTSSVTATNNTTLPSFTTLDLRLSHEIKFKNEGYGLTYYVGLLNATNSNYQVVLNRPMAPLSFELGAAFNVTGKKK